MATIDREGRPETLVAYAERRIKTAIADGTIEPGERLSPHLLAPDFGLSHIPIREALSSLTAKGYVVHKQGRGFFARQLSSEDLADIYHWRDVLEREAYRMAIPALTDEDLAEMASLIQQMKPLTAAKHRLAYLELNREFHFVAFRRTESRRLLRFLTFLWDSAQPYGILTLSDSTKSHEEHIEIMPLFEARDTEGVIAAMDRHRQVRVDRVAKWEEAQKASGGGDVEPDAPSKPKPASRARKTAAK